MISSIAPPVFCLRPPIQIFRTKKKIRATDDGPTSQAFQASANVYQIGLTDLVYFAFPPRNSSLFLQKSLFIFLTHKIEF